MTTPTAPKYRTDSQACSCPGYWYPRVGGGTRTKHCPPYLRMGLSPRGRGNPYGNRCRVIRNGSIPAWAGEPAVGPAWDNMIWVSYGSWSCEHHSSTKSWMSLLINP